MSTIIAKYKILFEERKIDYTESNSNLYVYCPFHNDTSPSLVVNKENGLYNCFSTNCNLGGGNYYTMEKNLKALD